MNQSNHWPIGSSLLSIEESSDALLKSEQVTTAFATTSNSIGLSSSFGGIPAKPLRTKPEKQSQEIRTFNWLGRP